MIYEKIKQNVPASYVRKFSSKYTSNEKFLSQLSTPFPIQ